jgi:lysophospholipase L1-like esterase
MGSRHLIRPGLLALLFVMVGCGQGPEVVADWRMVDRTVDLSTDDPPGPDQPGPDGVVDDYDSAQGPVVVGRNGNISARFPADGRYEVVLDACQTLGAARFTWSVEETTFETAECTVTLPLPEGRHTVGIVATDSDGRDGKLSLDVEVRDLIVVGLGDSFSAGSGNSRGGLVSLDYDNLDCLRSGRSGQAWAALDLEQQDPKTSVTFIHLACGGARATTGFLRAHNGQPPQILELSQILPEGQEVDLITFTIGGNDIRFSEIVGQLIGEPDAPLSTLDGEQLHARTQRKLQELRETMANVAACFGEGFEDRPCQVVGPSGRPDDEEVVAVQPIPVAPSHIIHVTYPDLTTRFVRDETGGVVLGPDGAPQIEICPSGAVEPPGDLVDGVRDGSPGEDPRPPLISGSEWSWGDVTLLSPADPAPGNDPAALFDYPLEAGGGEVPLLVDDTLNSLVMESAPRFGWTSSDRWWRDSRGHGYCSRPSDNWVYRAIFHPNDAGYQGKAEGLVAETAALGLPSP